MTTTVEIDFPYPESTPGADFKNNAGRYLRNLSEPNRVILNEMHDWVKTDSINLDELSGCILDRSLLLLRFLRANNFVTKKAKKHILKCMEWRKTNNVAEVANMNPEEILGCRVNDLVEHFPHWHIGYDKTGRPLLFKQQGEFDMKEIKKLCGGNFDRISRYHIWEQELMSRLCYEQSLKTRTIIETITVVLDVKGMTLSSLSSDFRAMMSALVKMDQDMYPETLGRILIVNAPSVFPMIWGVMKPWFDPITAAKIKVLGADPKKVLSETIGMENLPANYGGALPALCKSVHPYAEAMAVCGLLQSGAVDALGDSVTAMKVSAAGAQVPVTVFTATTTACNSETGSPAPDTTTTTTTAEVPVKKQREFIY